MCEIFPREFLLDLSHVPHFPKTNILWLILGYLSCITFLRNYVLYDTGNVKYNLSVSVVIISQIFCTGTVNEIFREMLVMSLFSELDSYRNPLSSSHQSENEEKKRKSVTELNITQNLRNCQKTGFR